MKSEQQRQSDAQSQIRRKESSLISERRLSKMQTLKESLALTAKIMMGPKNKRIKSNLFSA